MSKQGLVSARTGTPIPGEVQQKYVGFCDILGFSRFIGDNFEGTLSLYADLMNSLANSWAIVFQEKVKLTMYSDAILLVSDELPPLLSAVQGLCFFAGAHDFLIRGGVAYGKYWEQRRESHLFVVSDALIEAVRLEDEISVPAVVISPKIQIPPEYWIPRFAYRGGPFATPLLHFRGHNIVNPFGLYWANSAGIKVSALRNRYPEHAQKYDWYLDLLAALKANEPLVPQHALDWMVEQGLLAKVNHQGT